MGNLLKNSILKAIYFKTIPAGTAINSDFYNNQTRRSAMDSKGRPIPCDLSPHRSISPLGVCGGGSRRLPVPPASSRLSLAFSPRQQLEAVCTEPTCPDQQAPWGKESFSKPGASPCESELKGRAGTVICALRLGSQAWPKPRRREALSPSPVAPLRWQGTFMEMFLGS